MPKMAASFSETSVAVNTTSCTSRPESPSTPLWEFHLARCIPLCFIFTVVVCAYIFLLLLHFLGTNCFRCLLRIKERTWLSR